MQKQKPVTSFKKRLWHRCFPVNFAKFLKTRFSQNTYGDCFCTWLLKYTSENNVTSFVKFWTGLHGLEVKVWYIVNLSLLFVVMFFSKLLKPSKCRTSYIYTYVRFASVFLELEFIDFLKLYKILVVETSR